MFGRLLSHPIALLGILLLVLSGCTTPPQRTASSRQAHKIPPKEVWSHIQKEAKRYSLDPRFVYAIAWAESSLNASAATHKARGMMQMSKIAWVTVTDESYEKAWDWRTNVAMGTRYLGHCKKALDKDRKFSYPLLAASYRYGPTAVRQSKYKLKNLPKPHNQIYKELFSGNRSPVKVPS